MKRILLMLLVTSVARAAEVPDKALPMPGEVFRVKERIAFVIPPAKSSTNGTTPWVWYAPTLPNLPGKEEVWMFEKCGEAGIAIAGIDAGESYGSPAGRAVFSALYEELTTKRGFSKRPILLGRSRGGLQLLSWAAENADKVGGFAGVYPVCNIASYPGIAKAAPAYGLTPDELKVKLAEHNPIERLAALAKANIPLFAIHGDSDKLVPLADNSQIVHDRYEELGGKVQLIIPPGQGHNMWTGFFQCDELVNFVLEYAKP